MPLRSSNKYQKKNELLTERWRQLRAQVLKRDNYIDQYLYTREGKIKEADTVHHILPRETYPQYTYCDWNLISVSQHTHQKILHNAYSGKLTTKGEQLAKETAFMNGIKLENTTLVIGNIGAGKTTYVKRNIGEDGIAYDLDYIAAAFRLKRPKEESHEASRKMANRLLKGFIQEAKKHSSNVFIIRTAPRLEELTEIYPTRLVVVQSNKDKETNEINERISNCIEWCEMNNIPIEQIPPHSHFSR